MRKINRILTRWPEIAAIVPCYDPTNCQAPYTRFFYTDGSHEDYPRRIETTMKKVFDFFHVSEHNLLRNTSRILGGRSRRVPLAILDTFCLVPLTFQITGARIDRHHSRIGYVVLQQYSTCIRENDNYTTLLFHGGTLLLTIPQSIRTVHSQLDLAIILQDAIPNFPSDTPEEN